MTKPVEEPVEDDAFDELAPVLATLPLEPSVPFDVTEVAAEAAEPTNGHANGGSENAVARLLANGLANGASLDRPAVPTPASMEDDETPIFRSLRSNWLTADTGERPWADTEVDAGWDAADRVEAAPPTRRTESRTADAAPRQPADPRRPLRSATRRTPCATRKPSGRGSRPTPRVSRAAAVPRPPARR